MKPKIKMHLKSFIKRIVYLNVIKIIPDKLYLKFRIKRKTGKKLNFKDPKTFSEKVNYLKLFPDTPLVYDYADKIKVKEKVMDIVATPKTLWIGDHLDTETLDEMPKKFVLKSNAFSGDVWIVEDKNNLNLKEVNKYYNRIKKIDYHIINRENCYKKVEKKIFIEEFLEVDNIVDYKFFCFDGKVEFCHIVLDRFLELKDIMIDKHGNNMGFNLSLRSLNPNLEVVVPDNYDEMIRIAEKVSKPFSFVRVDLYSVNDKIYLGETTFYPWGGVYNIRPKDKENYYEVLYGSKIKIKGIKQSTDTL